MNNTLLVRPLPGTAIIEEIVEEERALESGIFVPKSDEIEGELLRGRVLRFTPRRDDYGKQMYSDIEEGQVVFLKKFGPQRIKIGTKEYLVADYPMDILAISLEKKYYE